MRTAISILILSTALLFMGCGRKAPLHVELGEAVYEPHHASGFVINETKGGGRSTVLTVTNPWQGADSTIFRLFLSRDGEKAPEGFDGAVAAAPLSKVVCMSSSYIAFIDALGEIDAVKGVSGVRYIANPVIRSRHEQGGVRDVGYDSNINFELVAALAPDLVLLYGVTDGNSPLTRKLDEMGIQYIYIGEYVEQSPLGKAEWLVAIGEMFDKRELAEEIFSGIEAEYVSVRDSVAQYCEFQRMISSSGRDMRPEVMLNAPWRDTWFVPGDRSYMVRLINDAGGLYVARGDDSERSRPLSAESAFVMASRSDVWIGPGQAGTLAEVRSLNPRLKEIPAVANGRVYNTTARSTPDGGSDFWESGALRADIVLKDFVKILQPGLLPGHEFYYIKHLQ